MLKKSTVNLFVFWRRLVIGAVLVGLTIVPRLYRIDAPVADWHSWRQSDTAAVARNFLKFGFDPLRPRYDDLSNIQSGRDNPEGYRMVEFPVYQLLAAALRRGFSGFSIEIWLRLVSIVAATFTSLLLYLIVAAHTNRLTGFLTGVFYALLPYSIYFGRAILPENFAIPWSLLSLYFLNKSLKGRQISHWVILVGAGLAAAVALLVKPTAIFLLIPAIYLFWQHFSKDSLAHQAASPAGVFIYFFTSLSLLGLWRSWIGQFPEGIPAYLWLLNSNGIRFKGAWFYWLFAERLGRLILGFWGLILLGLGILIPKQKKENQFFTWWLIGGFTYVVVFATGNVQHDYYQVLLLPVVVVYLARGAEFLLRNPIFPRLTSWALLLLSSLFAFSFSWYTVRTFYWINRPEIVEAGRLADQLLPPNARVIAPYNGDTTFLYQTNRQGWPLGFEIEKKLQMGATAYVTVSPTDQDWETRDLARRYTVLVRNDKYAIIDLTKPNPNVPKNQ